MKLPVKILQGLAAAVALAGMSGCGFTPTTAEAPTQADVDVQQPGEVCQPGQVPPAPFRNVPDGCPACGRG